MNRFKLTIVLTSLCLVALAFISQHSSLRAGTRWQSTQGSTAEASSMPTAAATSSASVVPIAGEWKSPQVTFETISGGKQSFTVNFTVTADGQSIKPIGINFSPSIKGAKATFLMNPIKIVDSAFSTDASFPTNPNDKSSIIKAKLEGRFISPTQLDGTLTIAIAAAPISWVASAPGALATPAPTGEATPPATATTTAATGSAQNKTRLSGTATLDGKPLQYSVIGLVSFENRTYPKSVSDLIQLGSSMAKMEKEAIGNAFAALSTIFKFNADSLRNVKAQTTKTDDSGKFGFDDVSPGKYTVFAMFKSSDLGVCVHAETKLFEIKDEQQATYELKLRPVKDFAALGGQFNLGGNGLIMCQPA
jgi:hypothetical protein